MSVPRVVSVNQSPRHGFSKQPQLAIRLVAGIGVEGDAHAGATVQHIYDKRRHPEQPNLRQVHLISAESLQARNLAGFNVHPGDLGENITTEGLDLLELSAGTKLHLGDTAVVEVTGLRTPCVQIDRFQPGLMQTFVERDAPVKYTTGIMAVVLTGGDVRPGDAMRVEHPADPRPLDPV